MRRGAGDVAVVSTQQQQEGGVKATTPAQAHPCHTHARLTACSAGRRSVPTGFVGRMSKPVAAARACGHCVVRRQPLCAGRTGAGACGTAGALQRGSLPAGRRRMGGAWPCTPVPACTAPPDPPARLCSAAWHVLPHACVCVSPRADEQGAKVPRLKLP
eukprot:366537-Chlamydomonas_euryale.AAC.1